MILNFCLSFSDLTSKESVELSQFNSLISIDNSLCMGSISFDLSDKNSTFWYAWNVSLAVNTDEWEIKFDFIFQPTSSRNHAFWNCILTKSCCKHMFELLVALSTAKMLNQILIAQKLILLDFHEFHKTENALNTN